jgi:hypothetical protein
MKMNRLIALAVLAFVSRSPAMAQCSLSPAECPTVPTAPYGSPEDSAKRMGNPLLPQEVTMENRLRRIATGVMDRITAQEHWTYSVLSEDYSFGYNVDYGSPVKYPFRPPHWLTIHYQVIVNEDSLQAWRSWLQDFAQRRMNAFDAALKGKVDEKTAARETGELDKEEKRMTFRYREASILIVEIEFNSNFARVVGTPMGSVPATAASGQVIWLNNPDPSLAINDYPGRSHHNAVLLVGSWKREPTGSYRPTWDYDKQATDQVSEKRIKSDQVQSIDVRLSGNAAAMKKWIADLPMDQLTSLIIR